MKPEILYSLCSDPYLPKDINSLDIDMKRYTQIESWLTEHKVQALIRDQKNYHYKLYQVKSSPQIIYALGNIDILNQDVLGIVGPRKHTEYAQNIMEELFSQLGNYSLVTISGLAPGVDTLCHELSIEQKIPTIAILGGGLRYYMRYNNQKLIENIINGGGLVLSDFKIDFRPTTYSFPHRNRLIAGLCNSLFLPEAGLRSGSLITAKLALQKKKPIYVTPNNIFSPNSKGSNTLLQDKNTNLVIRFSELLDKNFDRQDKQEVLKKQSINLSDDEKIIITFLNNDGEMDITTLSGKTGLLASSLMEKLTLLEMNSMVIQRQPGIYGCK